MGPLLTQIPLESLHHLVRPSGNSHHVTSVTRLSPGECDICRRHPMEFFLQMYAGVGTYGHCSGLINEALR